MAPIMEWMKQKIAKSKSGPVNITVTINSSQLDSDPSVAARNRLIESQIAKAVKVNTSRRIERLD